MPRALALVLLLAVSASASTFRYEVTPDGLAHELTLGCAGGRTELLVDGARAATASLASTVAVKIQGAADQNERLSVDFSSGLCLPPQGLDFDGGSGGYDSLEVRGGRFRAIRVHPTGPDSGAILFDDGSHAPVSLRFSNLEPVLIRVFGDDVTLNLSAGVDHAELSDSTPMGGPAQSTLASTNSSFPTLMFTNPGNLLTVNFGDGDDTLAVNSLATDFPSLTLNGQADSDTVTVNGSIGLVAGASINASAEEIDVNEDLTASGIGSIQLDASKDLLVTASTIQAVDGSIRLTANDANTPATGDFKGLSITAASTITSGGTASITLRGRGGDDLATSSHDGVFISASTISSTSTAADAGSIDIDGTGGAGTDSNIGLHLTNAASVVSAAGAISFHGKGGAGTSSPNQGIRIANGSQVRSTGIGSAAAAITLDGTGGSGTNNSIGVHVTDTNTLITSEQGNISITGQGGSGGNTSDNGIILTSDAVVSSTGTDASAATITLDGTGGSGAGQEYDGVLLQSSGKVSSEAGHIQITGHGGSGSGFYHKGVAMLGGAQVRSTGTQAPAATITIDGTGGSGSGGSNLGVIVFGADTLVTSARGAIQITGHAGSVGDNNIGVSVDSTAKVTSTGTGAAAATVTIQGTGGHGSDSRGVMLSSTDSRIASVDGAVQVTGTGTGSNGGDDGVRVQTGGAFAITGAADLTLTGTAFATPGASGKGVQFLSDPLDTPGAGFVQITGTGSGGQPDIDWDTLTLHKSGGSYTFDGTVHGTTLTVDAGPYSVALEGGGTVTNAVSFGNTGGAHFGVDGTETSSFPAGVTSTASETTLAGALTTSNTGLTLGALKLTATAALGSVGGAIAIASIDGNGHDLTIQGATGAGTLTVAGAVSNLGDGTGPALTVESGVTGLLRFMGSLGGNSGLSAPDSGSSLRFDQNVMLGNGDTGTSLAGAVQLDGLTFTGSGGLSFGNTTLSGGPVTVMAGSGDLVFTGLLHGGQALTLNSSGATRFDGQVGFADPVGSLTTDTPGTTAVTQLVTTAGPVTFGDAVMLSASMTSGGFPVTFSKDVTVTATSTIIAGAGLIHFVEGLDIVGNIELILISDSSAQLGTGTKLNGGILTADNGVTVPAGGSLTGTGNVEAPVTALSGSTVAPGTVTAGTLLVGSLDLQSGATLDFDLDGAGAGQSDKLNVRDTVSLGGATLTGSLGFTPDPANTLVLIESFGSTAVSGTFAGVPEGSTLTLSGKPLRMTYQGGTGNDVTLTGVPTVPGTGLPSLGLAVVLGAGVLAARRRRA